MTGKLLIPNADGVLEPSDVTQTDASATERVLSLACNSGGSGTGMSHYSVAARCGRKARLDTERRAMYANGDLPAPATKNHFVVGSVYHKLHELARSPEKYPLLDLNERWQNPNVAEGVRLYKGWLRYWGLDYWGRCIGVESNLTDNVTFLAEADPISVTGQLDMIVEMDQDACERAARRGLNLTPGRRIVDWKTADGPSNGNGYAEGLQALWYCHLWNLHHPQQPVDGVIFDVVLKRSRRKDRSVLTDDFQAFYVPCGLEPVDALGGMVRQGHRNVIEDAPNRGECVSWNGDVCPYRLSGECSAI